MRIAHQLSVAVLALALAGCAHRRTAPGAAEGAPEQVQTALVVDNQGYLDRTIYVMRSSQRVRLGLANGNSRARFILPSNIMFGATPLRFVADPIGGRSAAVSMEIVVNPGDEVMLRIPPSV